MARMLSRSLCTACSQMGARYREVVGNRNEFFRSRKSLFCISTFRNCTRRPKEGEPSGALVEGIFSGIQNNDRGGSTLFEIAALTVTIGSFTTWLNRRCIATLHSR